jgi:hypothetical protein
MIDPNGSLHAGFIVSWIFIALGIILVLVAIGQMMFQEDGGILSVVTWTLALCALLIPAFASWPLFDTSYHKFHHVTGTVQKIDTRSFDTYYALTIKETGNVFRCDDTRCSTLRPGDAVSLNCKLVWEYQAKAGWACRWY